MAYNTTPRSDMHDVTDWDSTAPPETGRPLPAPLIAGLLGLLSAPFNLAAALALLMVFY
ncbi:MAG: hypothetical protein ACXIVG_04915 [Pararhodobacter sp.]